jgi:FADH2 O2-dependent halogenase
LADALKPATRINEYKREADYSYCMDKFAGDGFVLCGDAARFVDPIFSSGISIALTGAKYASEAIVAALKNGDVSAKAFEAYETKMRSGVAIWYEFIRLYYKLLPMFTHFIASEEYRMDILQLLQGEVYDRAQVPVLDAMRKFIKEVESADNHLLRGALTSMSID